MTSPSPQTLSSQARANYPGASSPPEAPGPFLNAKNEAQMRVYINLEGRKLTARQSSVVNLLSQGFSNKQIAHELGLSTRTIENHVEAARRTAESQNVAALVATALRNGWIA